MTPAASRQWIGRLLVSAAVLCVTVLGFARAASAQVSAIGATIEIASLFVRGVDVAFDPSSNGYLVVGAQDTVIGMCVNAQGQPTRAAITIKPYGGGFGAYPRARYSPHANAGKGAFLVVWPVEAGNQILLHSRMVSCTDGLLGAEQIISVGSAWMESGPAIAYSATSQRFLVVWKGFPGLPSDRVHARLVDINGTAVGDTVVLSSGFGRDPGVAWNPTTNEFGVSFSGETATTVFSAFVRVPATNPAAFVRNTFNSMGNRSGITTITDIDYNPDTNRFVMTWFEFPGPVSRVAEFDAAGNLIVQRLGSATLGSYDALSVAYNPVSKTILLGGVDRVNDDVYVAELDGNGNRIGPETKVSSSTRPARYTRVASSTTHASWNTAFNTRNFRAMANQPVQTATAGTPGTPDAPAPPTSDPPTTPPSGPPTTPPPVTPNPRMNVDLPANGDRVPSNGFPIAGWAIDVASTIGPGVDAIHVWARPVSGAAGVFVGEATYGTSRPDLAAAFGQAYFTNSGFALTATLPPGTYDLDIYARSTIAGAFNNAQTRRVIVEAPVSIPRMWVDTPTANQDLSQNVRVSGWALDLASATGSGVNAVHVYAYPTDGAPPILVGVAEMGRSRPDVGAAFGSPRFNNSGFNVEGTLPRGTYTIVVYAHSSVASAFNNVFVIPVRVN
jgi:hypothetical protein